jgi:sulfate permease, SulP family
MNAFIQSLKTRFFSNVYGDLVGGLTTAIVALPIALAFGVASGLGPAAGIYGAIACGIFAAAFGGTPAQVSGPTGPMVVVAATIIGATIGNPAAFFAAVLLSGVILVLLGMLGAGKLIRWVPDSVISGFMTGVGVIIISLQLRPLLGLKGMGSVVESLTSLPAALGTVSLAATLLGLATIAAIYLLPLLTRKVPSSLIAVVVMTVLAAILGLTIPKIGAVPAGLPAATLPWFDLAYIWIVLKGAVYLALLSAIDSLMTSVIVDRISGSKHEGNQELIGQGIGNAVAGIIGGLPGSGATMRSLVNIRAGGKTRLSGVFHGLILLAVLVGLGPYAALIPMSCLAGVLITVGIGIIDYSALKAIGKAHWSESLVMLMVLAITVFADLLTAVAVGVALSWLLARLARRHG